jgi:hypothetical protein
MRFEGRPRLTRASARQRGKARTARFRGTGMATEWEGGALDDDVLELVDEPAPPRMRRRRDPNRQRRDPPMGPP